jgi:hypothetical protein
MLGCKHLVSFMLPTHAQAHAHDCDIDEINPTTGNRTWGKARLCGSLPTKITERYTCMHGESFLAACLCGRHEMQQQFARVAASLFAINNLLVH